MLAKDVRYDFQHDGNQQEIEQCTMAASQRNSSELVNISIFCNYQIDQVTNHRDHRVLKLYDIFNLTIKEGFCLDYTLQTNCKLCVRGAPSFHLASTYMPHGHMVLSSFLGQCLLYLDYEAIICPK